MITAEDITGEASGRIRGTRNKYMHDTPPVKVVGVNMVTCTCYVPTYSWMLRAE